MSSATHANILNRPPDFYVPAAALPEGRRPPNLRAETTAMREISKYLVKDPSAAVRHLLDIARHFCGTGSAGLSLLRQDAIGGATVRWQAISGALAHHEAINMPTERSTCGLCLDTGIAIVVSHPERVFTQLLDTLPLMGKVLIVPLHNDASRSRGTLWVAHHDDASFDRDDARVLEQLAVQMVLALTLQEQTIERRHALAMLESHQVAQRSLLSHDLHAERRLRENAEIEHGQALMIKDAMIDEVNHRTKNTLQVASNLLALHARTTPLTPAREALLDSAARLQLLAKVQALLHGKPGSTQSVFMPPLLQSLGNALRESFGRANADVLLQIECHPIELPAQRATALALVANEAITNAYKHAFPNQAAGTIMLKLERSRDGSTTLQVEDTGVGYTAAHAEGVGQTLIRTFAAQLNGTLRVVGNGPAAGTQITLTIDSSPEQPPTLSSTNAGAQLRPLASLGLSASAAPTRETGPPPATKSYSLDDTGLQECVVVGAATLRSYC